MVKPVRSNASTSTFRAGLIFILSIVLPALIYIVGFWRLLFMPVALWAGFATAAVAMLLLAPMLSRHARRSIDSGMHATLRPGAGIPWRERLTGLSVVGLVFFGWMMSALWVCAMLTSPPIEERAFQVQAVHECKGPKCSGCTHRARAMLRFEWTDTAICADEVQPPLRDGEQMIVRGYFHPLLIRIDSVRRPPATEPGDASLTSRP